MTDKLKEGGNLHPPLPESITQANGHCTFCGDKEGNVCPGVTLECHHADLLQQERERKDAEFLEALNKFYLLPASMDPQHLLSAMEATLRKLITHYSSQDQKGNL